MTVPHVIKNMQKHILKGSTLCRKQNKIITCIMLPETQIEIKRNLLQHPQGHNPTQAK